MWTMIKGAFFSLNFWLIVGIVLSMAGGIALIAHGRGYDKGLAIGIDRLEAHYAEQREMSDKENKRQIEYITIREPVITERIVYIEKEREEYEAVIDSNPSPVACVMEPARVRSFNAIGKSSD